MNNKTILKSVSVLILCTLLIGCSNNEYKEFKENFENIYFEITKSIDSSDISLTLERLQEDSISNKIDELNELLANIKDSVPENQIQHYQEMNEWYDGLVLLRSFSGNQEQLSFEDNDKIFNEIISINIRRKHYNDEDVK